METVVFVLAAIMVLAGAVGVVLARNPVHSALMLVLTLFGVAVLFVAQDAPFLAAVQVIVYAGAIVVLFLFVIMLLGVDRSEDLDTDPLGGQRPAAVAAGAGILGVALTAMFIARSRTGGIVTGARQLAAPLTDGRANVVQLGRALFTTYLFAFEITSALLVIAIVAAVVLARRPSHPQEQVPEEPDALDEPAAAPEVAAG